MYRAIANLLHRATPKSKYNILTFPTHERYESGLAMTGHNFYAWHGPGIKSWNTNYAKVPDNYILLNPDNRDYQLYNDVDIDFILSQNKFGQFDIARQMQQYFDVPIISLEHTLPMNDWHPEQLRLMGMMRGDIDVFISEFSRDIWGWKPEDAEVVHHGVDTTIFNADILNQRQPVVLSVVNDWKNRDWCCNYSGWTRIIKGLPFQVVGDNPGLSKAAGVSELVEAYKNALVFLNTSTVSPVPTSLLEAMSCGCAVVTTATCMIPEIIKNGENGFISNNESELRGYVELLLKDHELAAKLGQNARKTIEEKFSMDKFVTNWNNLFDKLMENV